MAYDEKLAQRIRTILGVKFDEKKMFGGLCFLVRGKMVAGILDTRIMIRCDPALQATLLKRPHVKPMDFTGKPMRGFLFVEPQGIATHAQLKTWISQSVAWVGAQK